MIISGIKSMKHIFPSGFIYANISLAASTMAFCRQYFEYQVEKENKNFT